MKEDNLSRAMTIAIHYYYWKPYVVIIRTLQLRLFCELPFSLQGPFLDLGCGDGLVTRMLQELGVLGDGFSVYGVEISPNALKKARNVNVYSGLIGGDVNNLPFPDESFSSIFSNGVLQAVPGGVEMAISELDRVLKKGGKFVVTVPTDQFDHVYFWKRVLGWVSQTLSRWYVKRMNVRLMHRSVYSVDGWVRLFEQQGLKIHKVHGFFSPKTGNVWSILVMQPFRLFALLKFLGNTPVRILVSRCLRKGLFDLCLGDKQVDPNVGYICLIGQKP